MRSSLLHALFPLVRAEILRLLFTNEGQELYVRELTRLSFLSLRTVQDELAKLRAAGLVLSRTNGYHRFYRANRKHPLYPSLRQIVIRAASHPRPKVTIRKIRRRKKQQPRLFRLVRLLRLFQGNFTMRIDSPNEAPLQGLGQRFGYLGSVKRCAGCVREKRLMRI